MTDPHDPAAVTGDRRDARTLEQQPLSAGTIRLLGSALGLALFAARRLAGAEGPPVASATAEIAATVGIVEGAPPVRERLANLVGHDRADTALSLVGVSALAFSGSSLGLVATGAAAIRLLSQARASRDGSQPSEPSASRAPPSYRGVDRYVRLAGIASFGYAGLTAVLTRSLRRSFVALVLVNPRAALVGKQVAGGELAMRDAIAISTASNVAGAVWGLRSDPDIRSASRLTHTAALVTIADVWLREWPGIRSSSTVPPLVDPKPERWGRQSHGSVLHAVDSWEEGLSSEQARQRVLDEPVPVADDRFANALAEQLRSPLAGLLAGGAVLSLAFGAIADVALIGAVILTNAGVGAWQEREAGKAASALERRSAATARVLRDGHPHTIAASRVVRGDVLLLAPGDRVPADARVLHSDGLEVDESALTGESLPVAKRAAAGPYANRVVLAGTDVIVGTARAVAVAVGSNTRMGVLGVALERESDGQTPLGRRLTVLLREGIPIIAASGALITISGLLWGRPLLSQLALGASAAMAALPEGLPLMAGAAEAAVSRRLASRNALVRRLAVIEALGRVDVACCDKTGTMTEGRLDLTLVASVDGTMAPIRSDLAPGLAEILLVGALATPHPGALDATAHPTDVAVVEAAQRHGLAVELRVPREAETSFDPVRSYHATLVDGRLCLKGALEALLPRCAHERRNGSTVVLTQAARKRLRKSARKLAERGLRVLLVAEGGGQISLDDPQGLVALGYLGISDPLRSGVLDAVRRCQEGGVRLVMLTGDHPATARAIASEAGILGKGDRVLSGAEIGKLTDAELDRALEQAAVVARITPLDKLRIVESLERRGHTVAMTGDGVNDGPALRLADVGIAMGKGGTEVARQAADVVLADDDFSTLVEALVEGRSFWQNMHRALGLLIGGNLGELGLLAAVGVVGRGAPLSTRQILTVNLVTDVLPALAVAVQQPEHRNLSALAREGPVGLGTPLRQDILRRGLSTAAPSFLSYAFAERLGGRVQAQSVAFASIVAAQLSQMLAVGHAEGQLTMPVLGAAAACGGGVLASLAFPPLMRFLELERPTLISWILIAAASAGAVIVGTALQQTASSNAARV